MKTTLGKNQSMIAKSIENSLLISGLFSQIGMTEKNDKIYIVAVPKYIYEDMLIEGEDVENFAYVHEMPGELSITDFKKLQSTVMSIGRAFMLKYTAGNRKLILNNSKEKQDD